MAKYNKFIVTFSFSDDDVRASFIELLEDNNFETEPDQSTFSLDAREDLSIFDFRRIIRDWIKEIHFFEEDDIIVIYYSDDASTIVRNMYEYNEQTGSLSRVVD